MTPCSARNARGARVAAVLSVLAVACVVAPRSSVAGAAADCSVKAGGAPQRDTPWAQARLGFQQGAWQITRGAGVLVAVVDSGLDRAQPQLAQMSTRPGVNVIAGSRPTDTRDCFGHGSAVAGLIAAPKVSGVSFVGVAPDATIVPIKQTNTDSDNTGTAQGIAAGIEAALALKARVINLSVTTPIDLPALRHAVADAARQDVVIVAAAGNDGQNSNKPAYPAVYSTLFPNVLAVSAVDRNDQVAQFSDGGNYVSVAAPGVGVEVPRPISGYQLDASGTSFAAPYVSGTAALLRSAFPSMSAAAVCARIKATADPPGASVPDRSYGYGIVNPNLALTAVRDDAQAAPVPARPSPLPAAPTPAAPNRHLQHLATGLSLGLLGLAGLAALTAAVVRRWTSTLRTHAGGSAR